MLQTRLLDLFGLILVAATLPLFAELTILTGAALLPAKRRKARGEGLKSFRVSILIPAHNEEGLIGRCVQSVLAAADADTEVLVVAHNCTDATANRAEVAGARVLALNDPLQTGKGCALNYGFAVVLAGSSQAVLVIDADSVVSLNLIAEVKQRFLSGALAVQCRYEVCNSQQDRRTLLMALAFQGFNVIRPRGRSRLGLSAGILGNGFALHRDVMERVPYDAHSVVEDLEYHLTLIRSDVSVEFIDTATVRGEMPVSDHGARTQRARWEGGRMRMMKRWAPRLIADLLRGNLRQLEPLLDLLSLPIAMGVTLLLIATCLPVDWLRFYALGAFLVLVVHVVTSAVSGSDVWAMMRVLATAPIYIVWKLWVFPEIWRTSRSNSAWVRTARESQVEVSK
jgi:cellulose synthase/poly-beta-1,6-N-acetylglucosamine synthase-like glycosyltransferase